MLTVSVTIKVVIHVRQTRTNDADETMTIVRESTFFKMADIDLAKVSLQMFVELYRENFAKEWFQPTLQRHKHWLRIASSHY